jgi:hypothetical protein
MLAEVGTRMVDVSVVCCVVAEVGVMMVDVPLD